MMMCITVDCSSKCSHWGDIVISQQLIQMVCYCFCRKESANLHVTVFLLPLFGIPSHGICKWFFFAVICEVAKCSCTAENLTVKNEINYSALRRTAVFN